MAKTWVDYLVEKLYRQTAEVEKQIQDVTIQVSRFREDAEWRVASANMQARQLGDLAVQRQRERDEARQYAHKLWRENEALDAELAKERDLCAELRQSWRQARGREETTSLLAARVFYDLGEVPDRD